MRIENLKKYRTLLLVLAYIIIVMMGITVGDYNDESSNRHFIISSLALAFVFTQICIVDRRIIGRPLPVSSYWLVLILWTFAVPVCIIFARGLTGLKLVAIHFVCMMLALFLSLVFTSMIVYGI